MKIQVSNNVIEVLSLTPKLLDHPVVCPIMPNAHDLFKCKAVKIITSRKFFVPRRIVAGYLQCEIISIFLMLSTLQKKPRTAGIFKKTLFIFFFVFSTIFCKLNPFCKVPTSEYACRHAQIDLFTSRKWIRVGISTLQPLKVQGGQNSNFSWFAKSELQFSNRKRNFDFKQFCKLQASYFLRKKSILYLVPNILVKLRIFKPKIIRLFEFEFSR